MIFTPLNNHSNNKSLKSVAVTAVYKSSIIKVCHFLNFLSFFSVILEKTIRIPRSLSVKAASILKGFLNKVLCPVSV